MKKLTTLPLICALSLSMVACGSDKPEESKENAQNVKEQAASMEKDSDSKHAEHEGNEHGANADKKNEAVVKTKSGIAVINPQAKPTHPGQKVSAAYFTITNPTDKDVEVTAVSSNVATLTEMHTMEMQDSKMIMRKLDKVVIPAGGEFVMHQGGNHIMLIELDKPLEVDDEVTINLELSNGEKLEVTTKVAKMEEGDMEMDHSKHEGHEHEGHEHEGHESDSH